MDWAEIGLFADVSAYDPESDVEEEADTYLDIMASNFQSTARFGHSQSSEYDVPSVLSSE